jgi:hypothetical protein
VASPDGKTIYVALSGTPISGPPQLDANGNPILHKGGDDDDDDDDKAAHLYYQQLIACAAFIGIGFLRAYETQAEQRAFARHFLHRPELLPKPSESAHIHG